MVDLRKLATYSFACNVGRLDRLVRLLAGILMVLAGVLVIEPMGVRIAVSLTGAAIGLTGVVSRCGIYYLLGTSTLSGDARASRVRSPDGV